MRHVNGHDPGVGVELAARTVAPRLLTVAGLAQRLRVIETVYRRLVTQPVRRQRGHVVEVEATLCYQPQNAWAASPRRCK